VMLVGQNTCTSTLYGTGALAGVSSVTSKLKVEGLPVLVNGSAVATFGTFPGIAATIVALNATGISVS
jgi:outer membrane receptor protein involved in Fe transport